MWCPRDHRACVRCVGVGGGDKQVLRAGYTQRHATRVRVQRVPDREGVWSPARVLNVRGMRVPTAWLASCPQALGARANLRLPEEQLELLALQAFYSSRGIAAGSYLRAFAALNAGAR